MQHHDVRDAVGFAKNPMDSTKEFWLDPRASPTNLMMLLVACHSGNVSGNVRKGLLRCGTKTVEFLHLGVSLSSASE